MAFPRRVLAPLLLVALFSSLGAPLAAPVAASVASAAPGTVVDSFEAPLRSGTDGAVPVGFFTARGFHPQRY